MITHRAGQVCEACRRGEDRAAGRRLEAHERWDYDDASSVQSLRRLICLCSDCHRSTHFGFAEINGQGDEAFTHLCAVTGMTPRAAEGHLEHAYALWDSRNTRTWALDLSILTTAGVTLAPPPPPRSRPAIAELALAPPPRPGMDRTTAEAILASVDAAARDHNAAPSKTAGRDLPTTTRHRWWSRWQR